MTIYLFLQIDWWMVVPVVGAALVFLIFVQGGQTLFGEVAHTEEEKELLFNLLGHKWLIVLSTLVALGGVVLASFNLMSGIVVFLAARMLGMLYVFGRCSEMEGDAASDIASRCQSKLKVTAAGFVLFIVASAYLYNILSHWWITAVFLIGLIILIAGLGRIFLKGKPSFYLAGSGVFLAVLGVLLNIGFGDMA